MKKNIFLGLGAVVLAIGGVIAGKASSKFAATGLYYLDASSNCQVTAPSVSANITTTGTAGQQLVFKTGTSGTQYAIYATQACGKRAYFHP